MRAAIVAMILLLMQTLVGAALDDSDVSVPLHKPTDICSLHDDIRLLVNEFLGISDLARERYINRIFAKFNEKAIVHNVSLAFMRYIFNGGQLTREDVAYLASLTPEARQKLFYNVLMREPGDVLHLTNRTLFSNDLRALCIPMETLYGIVVRQDSEWHIAMQQHVLHQLYFTKDNGLTIEQLRKKKLLDYKPLTEIVAGGTASYVVATQPELATNLFGANYYFSHNPQSTLVLIAEGNVLTLKTTDIPKSLTA